MPMYKIQVQYFLNCLKLPSHSKHTDESWEQREAFEKYFVAQLWRWMVLKILKHTGNPDFITTHTILPQQEQSLSVLGGSVYFQEHTSWAQGKTPGKCWIACTSEAVKQLGKLVKVLCFFFSKNMFQKTKPMTGKFLLHSLFILSKKLTVFF